MANRKGRKPLWEELDMPSKLESIKGWAMEGSTDAEIMEMLNVKKDTFYKWKKEIPEFTEALKRGRYESNGEILNSAFKQATGYFQRITEPMKVKRGQDWEEIEMVEYDKFFPANSALTIFMLKNRLGYRDRQEQQIDVNAQVVINEDLEE